jgi:hypothetical protein
MFRAKYDYEGGLSHWNFGVHPQGHTQATILVSRRLSSYQFLCNIFVNKINNLIFYQAESVRTYRELKFYFHIPVLGKDKWYNGRKKIISTFVVIYMKQRQNVEKWIRHIVMCFSGFMFLSVFQKWYSPFWNRNIMPCILHIYDRLCGLVVRIPGYRSRGPGFGYRNYQIF